MDVEYELKVLKQVTAWIFPQSRRNVITAAYICHQILFLPFLLSPTVIYTHPCSWVVQFLTKQYLLPDIIPHSTTIFSLPSPLYFHFHRPPSFVVFLSSHHIAQTTSTSFPGLPLRFSPHLCPPKGGFTWPIVSAVTVSAFDFRHN